MIEINIDPVLLRVGPLMITWHGFFTAVGVLAGIWLATRFAVERGYTEDDIMSIALWSVVGGIIGARLFHVVDAWEYYAADPIAILRVNDRGPFHSDRIMDVSYAAAVKLGFANKGTARVRVEALTGAPEPGVLIADRAPPPAPAVTEPVLATAVPMLPPPQRTVPASAASDAIYLQAGAFRSRAGAERIYADIARIVDAVVEIRRSAVDALYRVRVGPIATMAEANRLQALIARANHPAPLIVRE